MCPLASQLDHFREADLSTTSASFEARELVDRRDGSTSTAPRPRGALRFPTGPLRNDKVCPRAGAGADVDAERPAACDRPLTSCEPTPRRRRGRSPPPRYQRETAASALAWPLDIPSGRDLASWRRRRHARVPGRLGSLLSMHLQSSAAGEANERTWESASAALAARAQVDTRRGICGQAPTPPVDHWAARRADRTHSTIGAAVAHDAPSPGRSNEPPLRDTPHRCAPRGQLGRGVGPYRGPACRGRVGRQR